MFNIQLITSHCCCCCQKARSHFLPPTPTPPCSPQHHSPTPSHASSAGSQLLLQADLTHTRPRKPFQLICFSPIWRDDSAHKVLQVRTRASKGEQEREVKREGSLSLLGTDYLSSASPNHSFRLISGQLKHTM